MNYKIIAKKAKEGIDQLNSGVFPNSILEPLKDKRLRDDLSNKIFYPKGSPTANELSPIERKERAKRLKVELAFVHKMSGVDSFLKISFVLIAIGVAMLLFAAINNNGNMLYGVISVLEGVALFIIGSKNTSVIKNINVIVLIGLGLLVLEFAILQLPNPLLTNLDQDILASKRGAAVQTLNLASPFLYLVAKLTVLLTFVLIRSKIQKFNQEKVIFEKNAVVRRV
ncbi:MAG: hypothetical protein ACJASQ_001205 [Crocinitomicaceae bacterium]|jgi:hypothetical protein